MITKITGHLSRVLDDRLYLQVGAFEYEVLVPEMVRRQIQDRTGQELTLHTSHYFEGNPMQGRVVPRLVGFLTEAELEFFDLFCTVDKIGVRKALKALARPIRDIADAIQRKDVKVLSTLPGVGSASGEKIIAELHRKVVKFALMRPTADGAAGPAPEVDHLLDDAYRALLQVGHSPGEARDRLDKVIAGGRKFDSVEDILIAIYKEGPYSPGLGRG
jgi:holliday junction DNA helicase RuvA